MYAKKHLKKVDRIIVGATYFFKYYTRKNYYYPIIIIFRHTNDLFVSYFWRKMLLPVILLNIEKENVTTASLAKKVTNVDHTY